MAHSVLDGTIQHRIRTQGIPEMSDADQQLVDHISGCVGCAMSFVDANPHIERAIRKMSDKRPADFVKEACQNTY